MKLSAREKLTLAKEATKSLVRGNRAVRQGRATDDLSFCHGERSDPLSVRQSDPTHCYHGVGALTHEAKSVAVPLALSLVSFAAGALLLLAPRATPSTPLTLLALLLLIGGLLGFARTMNV